VTRTILLRKILFQSNLKRGKGRVQGGGGSTGKEKEESASKVTRTDLFQSEFAIKTLIGTLSTPLHCTLVGPSSRTCIIIIIIIIIPIIAFSYISAIEMTGPNPSIFKPKKT
jgi:hypothetical protein